MLGEVEETIYTVDEEEEGGNGEVRTVKKQSEMLFVRGKLPCCAVLFWTLSSQEGGVFRLHFADDIYHRRLRGPHFTPAITTFRNQERKRLPRTRRDAWTAELESTAHELPARLIWHTTWTESNASVC